MIKTIDPAPFPRDDGGTDYKIPTCHNPCYWHDADGAYVSQCPSLKVSVYGLECLVDDDDCD